MTAFVSQLQEGLKGWRPTECAFTLKTPPVVAHAVVNGVYLPRLRAKAEA